MDFDEERNEEVRLESNVINIYAHHTEEDFLSHVVDTAPHGTGGIYVAYDNSDIHVHTYVEGMSAEQQLNVYNSLVTILYTINRDAEAHGEEGWEKGETNGTTYVPTNTAGATEAEGS